MIARTKRRTGIVKVAGSPARLNHLYPTLAIADAGGQSLFAGPIIAREVMTAPRPLRYYLWRASFSCFLFILLWTAWQQIMGWQDVRELGVMARFGGILYVMFALIQLTLMLFFAPLFTAA